MTIFKKLLSLSFIMVAMTVFFSPVVRATDEQFYFHIPRLSADKALVKFAKQAEITLLYPFAEIKKYKTQPLFGRYTVQDGLQLMLSGTEIQISAGVGPQKESVDGFGHQGDSKTNDIEE